MGDEAFKWLRTGDEAFGEMLAAIAGARQSVRLETYIFAESPLGERFRAELIAACHRGARVRLLLDAFGSLSLGGGFWAPLAAAGGELRWFNPLALRRLAFRDHRKLLVCDDSVAVIGGFNIAPEYEGNGVTRGWRDVGLRISGAVTRDLAAAFDIMFARADFRHPPFMGFRKSGARRTIAGEETHLLLSGPGRGSNAIQRALLEDLARADRVRLIAAYFLPTGALRRALLRAARRGAQVQLILAGKTDLPLTRLASQGHYAPLLRAGAEVFEYQPQVLHTKLALVGDAVYAGSSNFDPRSLRINYELMVRATQPAVVAEAHELFAEHLAHSLPVDKRRWRAGQSFWTRLKQRCAGFLLGRLDPLITTYQWRELRRRWALRARRKQRGPPG